MGLVILFLFFDVLWPPNPASAQPGPGRRAAYVRYFAGVPNAPLPTLKPIRTIDPLPPDTLPLRDFIVDRGQLIGLQSPPLRNLVEINLARSPTAGAQANAKAIDLVEPMSLGVNGADGSVWIYDFRSGDLVPLSADGTPDLRQKVTLQAALFQPTWIASRIEGNGMFANELVRVFGPSGKLEGTLGHSPFPTDAPEIAMHLNRNAMTTDSSGRRMALAFLYISRLEILSFDGSTDRALSGPTELELRYRTVPDPVEGIERFLRTDQTRFAYVDVASDDTRIYALFSGRSRGQWNDAAVLADTLDVWTWTGDFIGEWRLPATASSIAVDPRAHRLYATATQPHPALLEFDTFQMQSRRTR